MESKKKITRKEFHKITANKKRNAIIRELTKEYGYKCWYCGYKFKIDSDIEIDHINPISNSGTNDTKNLALSCQFCNNHKWHYDVVPFLEYLSRIRSGDFECPILTKYKDKLSDSDNDRLQKSYY